MSSDLNQTQNQILCAALNSGRYLLPLSHSHALELVAVLQGAKDWNTLAARNGSSELHKAQAKQLRSAINAQGGQLPVTKAQTALALSAPQEAPPKAGRGSPEVTFAIPPKPIVFIKAYGPRQWQVENPNRLLDDRLDALLDRDDYDDHRLSRELGPLLADYPGDLELFNSAAVAKYNLGDKQGAAALWARAWNLASGAVEQLLRTEPKSKLSYSILENRPLYRIMHGHMLCLAADPASLDQAVELSEKAFWLSSERDGIGFRMLHTGHLALSGQWERLIQFVKKIGTANAAHFDIAALRAAASVMLGKTDVSRRFKAAIYGNAFAAEVVANGAVIDRPDDRRGVAMGSWQEGAEHIAQYAVIWKDSRLRAIWKEMRPVIREVQERWLREMAETPSAQADPKRHAEYIAHFRTPPYGGFVPILG